MASVTLEYFRSSSLGGLSILVFTEFFNVKKIGKTVWNTAIHTGRFDVIWHTCTNNTMYDTLAWKRAIAPGEVRH